MARKSNTKEFIAKANKKHKGRYGYSLVVYKNSRTKIAIVCRVHGIFHQLPGVHLQGKGCPTCARKTTVKAMQCK